MGSYPSVSGRIINPKLASQEQHAIEYQGGGHFNGTHATAARDAVKKEALRRAGIGYVEVVAGDTPAELRRVVERLVKQ